MHAAVVRTFGQPPRYEDFPEPIASGPGEVVVEVLAAGLHPRVRSQAAGSHYSSTDELPLVPGVDAVVRDLDGRLRYTILRDTTLGTMADRTLIDLERSVVLPESIDPVRIAAAMNPAMSSWIALRRRVRLQPQSRVLILGATGNAGRLAIQIANHFGAAEVIAVGRDPGRLGELSALGADVVCTFEQLDRAAAVDVVLDYVWGAPTSRAMRDVVTHRPDRSRPLTWIEVGAIAGSDAAIPAAALRSSRLEIVGSGIGSVPGSDFVEELPDLAAAMTDSAFDVRARPAPLSDVADVWISSADSTDRIVLVP